MTERKEAGHYHLIIDIDYYIMVQENLTRMHSYKWGDETKGEGSGTNTLLTMGVTEC